MRQKAFLFLWFVFFCEAMIAQSSTTTDTITAEKESKWHLTLDLASRYLWRGQCWGGNYAVVQPTIQYQLFKKLSLGTWATTNFKGDYFYPDGITSYKGYQEIDFFITYKPNDYLTFQLWDYYWPTVEKVGGINNGFFNYSYDGVKTVDLNMIVDFSSFGFPCSATVSTLLAGNDFRFDADGMNPKQNFTTYAEVSCYFENVLGKLSAKTFQNITVSPTIGAVFNNQAKYYTAGDYDKVSLVNLSVKTLREFELSRRLTMPVSITFVHNGATRNTEVFGRNFLVFGLSFAYN